MPDHKLHRTLDLLLLTRDYPQVHEYMDQFQPTLQSNHRLLMHDMETVEEIRMVLGDEAGFSALLHILLDKVSDIVGQERSIPVLIDALNRNGL